jgi:PBP1b-binding outer membrane lipoprotein LpoB
MKIDMTVCRVAALVWSAMVLTGCSGGGGSSGATDPTPTTVQGVSTPSNVSVVTAKNAD